MLVRPLGLTGSHPPSGSSRNKCNGGERGIRTPDRGLAYTRFPSVRLKPLGHLSARVSQIVFAPGLRLVSGEEKASGGREGIRTPDTVSGIPVFKTGAINHSATLPRATPRVP